MELNIVGDILLFQVCCYFLRVKKEFPSFLILGGMSLVFVRACIVGVKCLTGC